MVTGPLNADPEAASANVAPYICRTSETKFNAADFTKLHPIVLSFYTNNRSITRVVRDLNGPSYGNSDNE